MSGDTQILEVCVKNSTAKLINTTQTNLLRQFTKLLCDLIVTNTALNSVMIKYNTIHYFHKCAALQSVQCFEAVGWVAGRASGLKKTEWLGAGVVVCLTDSLCRLAYGPADATATHCLLFQ